MNGTEEVSALVAFTHGNIHGRGSTLDHVVNAAIRCHDCSAARKDFIRYSPEKTKYEDEIGKLI